MKHPSLKELQNYFENESSVEKSERISLHLKTCDKCTFILSQMAKVDILISQSKQVEVPGKLASKTKSNALALLKEKRAELKKEQIAIESRKDRNEKIVNFVKDYKANLLNDLKLPVMQASALFILMGVLTEISRTETIISDEKIINNEFTVFYSELEGESNEDV